MANEGYHEAIDELSDETIAHEQSRQSSTAVTHESDCIY